MKPQPLSALATVATLACVAATAQSQDPGTRFDAAHAAYSAGHYRSAFDAFASLADQGHCDAARIASQMARWGQPLYAQSFVVSIERQLQWRSRHACAATTATAAAAQR